MFDTPLTIPLHPSTPECIQEATSEFISFITSEAADRATSEKRKTITGDDILNALKTLGFDEMSEVLLIYLAKYREVRIVISFYFAALAGFAKRDPLIYPPLFMIAATEQGTCKEEVKKSEWCNW
jgi:nuclear transcription Y subunit beta